MKFHFDAYDRADSPILVLCNPTDKPLGEIFNYRNLDITLCFTDISELSFDISQFYDDEITGERIENTLYSKLQDGREILVTDIMVRDEHNTSADRDLGYFVISDVSEEADGDNTTKSVTARSCEVELQSRGLHYVDGTFKIYEENDDSCLLNQILKRVRKWSIGTVSASVASMYRTFDYEASLNVYDFLMTSFSESCNCIIEFDILNRVINVFDKSTYLDITTQRTHIAISLEDIIDNMTIDTGMDGLYTALYVPADGDLNIASVNPARENIIYNFSYYKTTDWMSQELIDALDKCEIAQNLASTRNKKYIAVESPLSAIGDTKDIIYKDDINVFAPSMYNSGIKYNKNYRYNVTSEALGDGDITLSGGTNITSGDGMWKLAKKIDSVILTSNSPLELYKYNDNYMCLMSNQLLPYRLKDTDTLFTSAPKLNSEAEVAALTKEGYFITDYDDSENKSNSANVYYTGVSSPMFAWCVNRSEFHLDNRDIDGDVHAFKDWLDDNNNSGSPVTLEYIRRRPNYTIFDSTTQTQLDDKYPDGGVLAIGTSSGGTAGSTETYDRIIHPEYTAIPVNSFSINVDVYNEVDGGSAPTDGTATYFPTSGQTVGDFFLADHNYTKNIGGVDTVIITPDNVDIYKFDGTGYELTSIDNVTVSEVLITALKYEKEKQSYIESVITTLRDADLVNYDAQRSAIISSSSTDEIKNQALAIVNQQIEETKNAISKWSKVLSDKNELIKKYEERLEVIAKRIRFEDNLSPELLEELYCFVREGEYSDDNLTTTDIMSYAEEIDQSIKLFTQAQEVLEQVSTPSKEFSIEVGSSLYDKEFDKLSEEINTGSIIGVFDTNDNIEEYVLKQIDINDEDKTVELTFGNRLRMADPESAYADLYENISKTSNTVDYIKQTFDFKEANRELASINDFRNSSLDLSRNAIVSSTDQDMVIDSNGLKGRRKDADTGEFEPEQVWLTNNALAFSDDGFSTVKTALGKIPIPAGMLDNDTLVYKYGINGEVIIGKILLGERAVIGDTNGNVNISGDGIEILNGKLTVKDDNGDTIMSGSGLNADKLTVGNIKFDKQYTCTYEYFNTHKATGANAANMGLYMSIFYESGFPYGTLEYDSAQQSLKELDMDIDDINDIVATMNGVFDPDGDGVVDPDEAYIYSLFDKLYTQKLRVEAVGHTMTLPDKIEYNYHLELDRSLTRPLFISQYFDIGTYYFDGTAADSSYDERRTTSYVTAYQISTSRISANSMACSDSETYAGYNFTTGDGAASMSRVNFDLPYWSVSKNGVDSIPGFTSGPIDAFPQGGGTSEYRSYRNALTVRYKDTSGYVRQKSWLDIVHPVNSVALTATNINPGLTWGGSWSSISSIGGQYAWKRTE